MKISNKNCTQFEDIGTIFAYQERLFYPNFPDSELSGYIPKDKKEILGTSELNLDTGEELVLESGWGRIPNDGARGYIMFPSSHISDLTENSLYNFDFDLLGDKKYIPNFYPGLLDDYSQGVLDSGIDIFSSYMVPQTSPSNSHTGPIYFGGFQDKEGIFIKLIKVPAWIWKLEIYNEPRITYNIFFNGKYRIIDHDTLTAMKSIKVNGDTIDLTPLYEPSLKIYFGPEHDTRIEGQSIDTLLGLNGSDAAFNLYTDRYFSHDESLKKYYNNYPNSMSEIEYVESYKGEVMSDKILYLAYSGEGEIKEIKLIETSFDHHNNPGRNQRKLSMRMDDYLAHKFSPLEDLGGIVLDKSSGTILGTQRDTGFWFFERSKEMALPSLRTPRNKEVEIDGKVMVNGNREKIYQNPIVSPDWIVKRDIESDYLKCRISASQGGVIYRKIGSTEEAIGGSKYFKKGTKLILKPIEKIGYRFLNVSPDPDIISEDYYTYNTIPEEIYFKFEHKIYKFRVRITCEKDYYASNGCKITVDSGDYLSFTSRGIKLYFGDPISGFKEYSPDKDGIPKMDENTEISFTLDLGDYYNPVSFNLGEVVKAKLEDLSISGEYADYVVEISVVRPEISLFGDVEFKNSRHLRCDFSGSVKIEFYSEDELWDIPGVAVNHIFIKRGDKDVYNPTVESGAYNKGNGDGYRSFTLGQIKEKINVINIWTQE